jgi:hypothetical protein
MYRMLLQVVPEDTVPALSLSVPVKSALSKEVRDDGSTPLFPGGVSLHRENLKLMVLKGCTGLVTVSTYLLMS